MERSLYPALASNPSVIHFDASAAFPIHINVAKAVERAMRNIVATPSKASYDWASEASQEVAMTRASIARLLDVDSDDIHFSYSATDSFRLLLASLVASGLIKTIVYSPEDHNSVVQPLLKLTTKTAYHTSYDQAGKLVFPDGIPDATDTLIVITHIHPLYGRMNSTSEIRKRFPNAIIVVDASQSIARDSVGVTTKGCDALFFSSQKLGGIPGVGVTYIKKNLFRRTDSSFFAEPNTLSLPAITGLAAAIELIQKQQPISIELTLSKLTIYLIEKIQQEAPSVRFAKGPAFSDFSCSGYGIVSFSVDGYTSADVAMILNDHHINVRAADHCVNDTYTHRDVVRVSMYLYNTIDEIDQLAGVLGSM
jgi:cysteine desulfurase/selenocysteine lyase